MARKAACEAALDARCWGCGAHGTWRASFVVSTIASMPMDVVKTASFLTWANAYWEPQPCD